MSSSHAVDKNAQTRADSGYAVVSSAGYVIQVNRQFAQWLGRSESELCSGSYLHSWCDEASAALLHAQYSWLSNREPAGGAEAASAQKTRTGRIHLRSANGLLLPFQFECIPLQTTMAGDCAQSATEASPDATAQQGPDSTPSRFCPAARFRFTSLVRAARSHTIPISGQEPAALTADFRLAETTHPLHQHKANWTEEQIHSRNLLAIRAGDHGLWDWDQRQNRAYYSAQWQRILGMEQEELTAGPEHFLSRLHHEDRERFLAFCMGMHSSEGGRFEGEYRMRHASGEWLRMQVRGICVYEDEQRELSRVVGTICDVTRDKALDPLTGLHNRFSLLERLNEKLARVDELDKPFAVLFLDLDSFKRINDSFSHLHGDAVLVEQARRIGSTLTSDPASFAARIGGDEFVIVLDGIGQEDAATYTHSLQLLLQAPVRCGAQQICLTASVGIAMSTIGYADADEMLQDADMAMFRAKAGGKATFCFFTRSMREKIRERMQVEVELRRAIQANELVLHYQPKVLLKTGQIIGFEALVRWNHPKKGLIGPGGFIPIAEESDLILGVGRWTMVEAIRQASAWRQAGILPKDATMAVNLSARQFADYGLVNAVRSTLFAENLNPRFLDIEVTESALIDDTAMALSTLNELKALGVGLDLDDFGMGYSSLSYLHQFPFDTLKVDRSFVMGLGQDHESSAIARSIIALGAALNMKVLGEGIETAQQADRLLSMGCLYGQGYYFSPPLPAAECVRLLTLHSEVRKEVGISRICEQMLAHRRSALQPIQAAEAVRSGGLPA